MIFDGEDNPATNKTVEKWFSTAGEIVQVNGDFVQKHLVSV
jgi:hypothetical protein